MKKQEIFDNYEQYILSTYARTPVILVKGKGCIVTDIDGKKYLDFFPGWGVSNVGHCHPKVVSGVRDQIGTLVHVSNNYYHSNQAKLAKEIIRRSFDGKIFFCNSGAEANEAAIKFARAYGEGKRYEIITLVNSFHGRTIGALTATGQKKHHEGFQPLLTGFKYVPLNDLSALKAVITEKTVAIMLELVQGEGGIYVADQGYVQEIRKICNEKNILLILDEVQTGMGRTGQMFGYQNYEVTPDLMTLAKSLGGGLPIGCLVVKNSLAGVFKPGMHGSTFAGSPVVCKAALGVFKAIDKDRMLKNVKVMGEYLRKRLLEIKENFECVKEVRGLGLMWGIEVSGDVGPKIVEQCLKHGLLINCTQGNCLRIMPPLIVTKKQIDKGIFTLKKSIETVSGK